MEYIGLCYLVHYSVRSKWEYKYFSGFKNAFQVRCHNMHLYQLTNFLFLIITVQKNKSERANYINATIKARGNNYTIHLIYSTADVMEYIAVRAGWCTQRHITRSHIWLWWHVYVALIGLISASRLHDPVKFDEASRRESPRESATTTARDTR